MITFIQAQGDPSADPAYLLIVGGFVSGFFGQIVTGVAFIARGGARRVIGSLLFAGAAVFAPTISFFFIGGHAPLVRFSALAISLIGWLSLGVLVSRSGKGTQPVPSASQ